jgi:hypothetical protein
MKTTNQGYQTINDIRNSWGPQWANAPDSEVFDAYVKASGVNREEAASFLGYHPNVSTSYLAGQYNENLGAAAFDALWMTLLATAAGILIFRVVRGKKKITASAAHTGIKWAAYSSTLVLITSTHQFINKGFIDGLVALIASLIVFPAVAYFFGYIFRLIWPATSVSPLSVEGSEVPKTIDERLLTSAAPLPKNDYSS